MPPKEACQQKALNLKEVIWHLVSRAPSLIHEYPCAQYSHVFGMDREIKGGSNKDIAGSVFESSEKRW